MTVIDDIEKQHPHVTAEIKACLWPVRVGARTIRAVRRSWTAHDIAAVDLLLQELGWRLTTIDRPDRPNIDAIDPCAQPLFQVVPIPPEERPERIRWNVPCDMCGHWSSDIDEGLCPGCRRRFFVAPAPPPDRDDEGACNGD